MTSISPPDLNSTPPWLEVPDFDPRLPPLKLRFLGDPILERVAAPVEFLPSKTVEQLVLHMDAVIAQHNALGLAAPQVGYSWRVIVVRAEGHRLYMINPEILTRTGEVISYEEGCLSIPGFRTNVRRAERIRVRFQDLSGKQMEIEGEGLVSYAIQHELNHLDGITILKGASRNVRRGAERSTAKYRERFGL